MSPVGVLPMIFALIKVAIVLGVLQGAVAYVVWIERKVIARMQMRSGPNRVGFGLLATLPVIGPLLGFTRNTHAFGLGQPLADGIKLFLKEDLMPKGADKWTFRAAPLLALAPAFVGFAVIPFGPDIVVAGETIRLQISESPVALLFLLALGTCASYGVVLAGWSSNSKYSMMGALRAMAQLVSYELPLGLAFLSVILYSGSLSLREIISVQAHGWWFAFSMPVAFVIAVICAIAEANRTPFDLAEAESELVGGFHTEYSGMKFALFFLAEYTHMFLGGSILTALFLGGWTVPFLAPESTPWALGVISFSAKVMSFMLLCIWLRATVPRFRYDQLMNFTWKYLTPIAAIHLIVYAVLGKIFQ